MTQNYFSTIGPNSGLIAGNNITLTNSPTGTIIASTASGGGGGSGTVTSVSSGNLNTFFTSSVANSTTTPSISYSITTAASATVFCNPASSTGTPGYYPLIAQNNNLILLPTATGINLASFAVDPTKRRSGFWLQQLDSSTFTYDGGANIWSLANSGYGYGSGPAGSLINSAFMAFLGTTGSASINQTTPFTQPVMLPRFHATVGFNNNSTYANVIYAIYLAPTSGDNSLHTTATPLNNVIGFRLNTAAGDTTWQCYSSNGSSYTVVPTYLVPKNGDGDFHIFRVDLTNYPNFATFYIDNNLVGTITTNLPAGGTKQAFYFGLDSLDSRTVYLEYSRVLVESN